MECIYLERCGKNGICNASLTLMVPSIFERQVYCDTTEEHYRCPILIAHTLRAGSRKEAARAGMLCSR
ncbi:MAG: hypothetical protein A3G39_09480 [Deltaproteobacteria bacterium RIFCSPLOWO2_12_FULL_43_16]|nr:MAG: hypothetical protein A3D30_02945 [Deltaproteobacteria bacterium RIFCSPHIGHO2_02_FULL_43_33]OGQ59101.1 MAG: hypothetical protein A3G39_09480 [Deltaproteobacteria bacterium RIFCSPLOWO2_12_FULL_43_16]HBR17189.1 hypothetical protein [Deltaproteobacteria bacterium]